MSKHDEKSSTWEGIKRQRDGDTHIRNCTEGFKKPGLSEVHHVLTIYACSDKTMPKGSKTFLRDCLAKTTWDINKAGNLIGLPKKWAYVNEKAQGQMLKARRKRATGAKREREDEISKKSEKDSWDKLPCHQVDHPMYTKAVEAWVITNIWGKVQTEKKKKPHGEAKGKDIGSMFRKGSKHFKKKLNDRGKENGGTKHCIEYAATPKKDRAKRKWKCDENNWYVAFSMDIVGTPRERAMPPCRSGSVRREGLLNLVK